MILSSVLNLLWHLLSSSFLFSAAASLTPLRCWGNWGIINSFRYTVRCPWTHHQWCNLRSWGVSGLSTIRPPLPGDPVSVDQAPAPGSATLHATPLLFWSTAILTLLLLRWWPTQWPFAGWPLRCPAFCMPCRGIDPRILNIPLRWVVIWPTITPALLHFLSLTSSIPSSQGTVSSKRLTCLESAEVRTMSGLSVVLATTSGNFNCFARSALSSQSCAVANRPGKVFQTAAAGFSPAFMRVTCKNPVLK